MREKRYVAQNRGVYMFRIDEDLLVDATMAGGPARFVFRLFVSHRCCFIWLCVASFTDVSGISIIPATLTARRVSSLLGRIPKIRR